MNNWNIIGLAACWVLLLLSTYSVLHSKPLKTMGAALIPAGISLVFGWSDQVWLGAGFLTLGALYFLRGFWLFAYRKTGVLCPEPLQTDTKSIKTAAMRIRQQLGQWGCGLASAVVVTVYLEKVQQVKVAGNWGNYWLEWTAALIMGVLLFYWLYKLACIILFQMLAPLFIVKSEKKQKLLQDVVMIGRQMGKYEANDLYVFFGRDDYFVTYRNFAKKLQSCIGHICEYTVDTDIFGNECMRKPPHILSLEKEKTAGIRAEEVHPNFRRKYSLKYQLPTFRFRISGVSVLAFSAAATLIGMTLLFLEWLW